MNELYNELTAEALFDRMMDRYKSEFDKREGSIVWDEFKNVSIELRHLYIQLDWQWRQMFGDTADRDALIRLAADRDIYPLPATAAHVLGAFNIQINLGERFNSNDINFVVVKEYESDEIFDDAYFRYVLRSETLGESGNVINWDLRPIRNIDKLSYARIERILIPGEDDEDTEAFRARYYESLKYNKYGFNIAEYQYQVNLIPGVGACRTYPADPVPGHVRIVILDAGFMPASSELISTVQEILDPVPYHQLGIGRVPIGHLVDVQTAEIKTIDIAFHLTLDAGVSLDLVKDRIHESLNVYFDEIRGLWQSAFDPITKSQSKMIIRISQLETRILSVDGIIDITGTTINGVEENYIPIGDELPILGTVNYV